MGRGDAPPTRTVDFALAELLNEFYFEGENLSNCRYLCYGTKFHFNVTDLELRISKAKLDGFAKKLPYESRDPTTWEEALLTAEFRLRRGDPTVAAEDAAYILLTFDGYLRPSDLTLVRPSDLTPPSRPGRGPQQWAITLFPATRSATSKSGARDDTIFIGRTNPRRAWLNSLLPPLARRPAAEPLFSVTLAELELR